ncbi:hypothetical protein BGX21_010380, partial [Mortierella sp. AD011]
MFGQQTTQQQTKLQFPTNYHLQQQQQQQPTHPMAMPMSFHNHQNNNNAATPNNSFAGTIDPGLLQMTMNRIDMSQLQNMNSLFPQTSGTSLSNNQALLGRGNLGTMNNNLTNPTIKQEAASPDYLASEIDFGEPGNMLSPGSTSPLNSPLNDFEGSDDFSTPNTGAGSSSLSKPAPLNIHPGSYGESPGSLYSPGLESDFFPEGDFSLPKTTRPLDMKFGRMHPNSLPANPFHSMSMPVQRSEWFGAGADGHSVGSYENPSGLQFAQGEMNMMDSLFEDGSDP